MEVIRKKICIDNYRSHIPGVAPYVMYGDNDNRIQLDNELNNYGHFVCDIITNRTNENEDIELCKLTYLEALRKYYTVRNIVKEEGIFLKKCDNAFYQIDTDEYYTSGSSSAISETTNFTFDFEKNCYYSETCVLDSVIMLPEEYCALFGKIADWWDDFWDGVNFLNGDFFSAFKFCAEFEKYFLTPGNYINRCVNTNIVIEKDESYWENDDMSDLEPNSFYFVSPSIEIPICLEGTYTDEGLYTAYEYDGDENGNLTRLDSVITEKREFFKFSGATYALEDEQISGITVESQLYTLLSPNTVDYGDGVMGVPVPYNNGNGKIIQCIYHESGISGSCRIKVLGEKSEISNLNAITSPEELGENVIVQIDNEPNLASIRGKCVVLDENYTLSGGSVGVLNDDSEFDYSAKTVYNVIYWDMRGCDTNIDSFTCINGVNPRDYYPFGSTNSPVWPSESFIDVSYETSVPSIFDIDKFNDGNYIFVRAKFGDTLDIPYEEYEGEFEEGLTYNVVTSATERNNVYTIKYVLGQNGSNINSGYHYTEFLPYKTVKKKVLVDGIYETELTYKEIVPKIEVDGKEVVRRAVLTGADITRYEYESATTIYDGEEIIIKKKPLMFFDPSMDGLVEPPKVDINFSIDRGAGAAWERHFKLMECNTMEDLENYGNNYFNARTKK